MGHLFQSSDKLPFHVSIGAVLTDEQGRVCCHFFNSDTMLASRGITGAIHLLMRETLEPGETIEGALVRGLREEFGATGVIRGYLGSIQSTFPRPSSGSMVEKTTLYFHVEKQSLDESLRAKDDLEAGSVIQWIEPKELHDIFIEQGKRFERTDLDESKIIASYINHVAQS
ncbi:MAG: NUDIX hydrolase [Candidatus Campbellbacteria bacterium]|nr:NUDIX hydrolase [Candidatus Campbellbacteria bacterium]